MKSDRNILTMIALIAAAGAAATGRAAFADAPKSLVRIDFDWTGVIDLADQPGFNFGDTGVGHVVLDLNPLNNPDQSPADPSEGRYTAERLVIDPDAFPGSYVAGFASALVTEDAPQDRILVFGSEFASTPSEDVAPDVLHFAVMWTDVEGDAFDSDALDVSQALLDSVSNRLVDVQFEASMSNVLQISNATVDFLCPADLNLDGATSGDDLFELLGAWGPADPGDRADINADGVVDGHDLFELLGRWGECPQQS